MATSSSVRGFTFGIEMEIYLKPKTSTVKSRLESQGWTSGTPLTPKERNKNRVAMLNTVAFTLVKDAALTAIVPDPELENAYTEWQIKGDSSLVEEPESEYYGVEMISPIMSATEPQWIAHLDIMFLALAGAFHLHVNPACSTHIHMQPVGGWKVADVRSLFKATAVFDDAITKIMPAPRKQTPWARSSFREITAFDPKDPKQVSLKPKLSKVEQDLLAFQVLQVETDVEAIARSFR
ncbi:putative amidoligase [Chaetomidium leptoderma]|uniref:Amidoligase n=1 Tax=Chaetomidium leptoderma TaxID=669021 RepID=A0AAN6ZX78_9PEZI|nr:putative amidoligase [Chaetomidium leptoderma]